MVFFTCGGCGEAVKKVQVEKHRWRCRSSTVMSCIDCNKDFRGDDYQTHIKCISENEKYGGQNYVGKANKGELKQEKWLEQVQCAIDSTNVKDHRLRALLEQVKNFANIPRKQQKFESFLKNSLKVHDRNLVSAAWAAIAASLEKNRESQPTELDIDEQKNADQPNKNGKKRKAAESNSVNDEIDSKRSQPNVRTESDRDQIPENGGTKKFKWRKAIKAYLKTTPGDAIKLKTLKKTVINQYKHVSQDELSKQDLNDLFKNALDKLCTKNYIIVDDKFIKKAQC